jgi:hypothetical protein
MNPKYHLGPVCKVHPELDGLRYLSNGKCIPCHKLFTANWRKDAANAKKAVQYARKWQGANKGTVNAINTEYRITKMQQCPAWADQDKIKQVYLEAALAGKSVDHVIPLRGELVSGLHVHNNLQLLTKSENSSKSNTYEV